MPTKSKPKRRAKTPELAVDFFDEIRDAAREWMKVKGLSQTDVAGILGIGQQGVQRFLAGITTLSQGQKGGQTGVTLGLLVARLRKDGFY